MDMTEEDRVSSETQAGHASTQVARRTVLKGAAAGTVATIGPGVGLAAAEPRGAKAQTLVGPGGATSVTFDQDGRLVAMVTNEAEIPVGDALSGLVIEDRKAKRAYGAKGTVVKKGDALVHESVLKGGGLSVSAEYRFVSPETLEVSGRVRDTSGKDRAVNVVFTVPLATDSASWQSSINDSEVVKLRHEGRGGPALTSLPTVRSVTHTQSIQTASAVLREGQCLAYSLRPDRPNEYRIGLDLESAQFYVRTKLGLSQAVGHGTGEFCFRLTVLPGGEIRHVLKKLYELDSTTYEAMVKPTGIWEFCPPAYVSPEYRRNILFHQAGRNAWDATNVEQYSQHDGWSDNPAHAYVLPYTNVYMASISYLPEVPKNLRDAMRAYSDWEADPFLFGGNNHPPSWTSSDEYKKMIRACGKSAALLRDPEEWKGDGPNLTAAQKKAEEHGIKYVHEVFNGRAAKFELNPNPHLGKPGGTETIAGYMLNYHVPMLLDNPRVSGVMLDVLHFFGGYNYRRDHFPSAARLSYADDGFEPAIWMSSDLCEYLFVLRDLLRKSDKIMLGNLPGNVFIALALDVIAAEILSDDFDEEASRWVPRSRSLGYRKPCVYSAKPEHFGRKYSGMLTRYSLLYAVTFAMNPLWKLRGDAQEQPMDGSIGEDYGMQPAKNGRGRISADVTPDEAHGEVSENEVQYQREIVPVVQELHQRGWEPVTGVTSSHGGVLVERFGDGASKANLVVWNKGNGGEVRKRSVDLELDPLVFPDRLVNVSEVLSVPGERTNPAKGLSFELQADELKVLELEFE
ncbi:hypothetical protein [Microlunatus sp. GCM10028923]|uniref:hypothetical protein n=1 Tax=Microlunatus sp. GCM10028923 TaxID=3273400 RepID=UPI00361782A8